MPQLDVHTYSSQIFWLVVSFLLLFAVVRGMASPRLTRVFDERAARTGGDLSAAERAREAAAARDKSLAERTAVAHDSARAEVGRATDAAREKTSGALAAVNARLAAQSADAEARLHEARAHAEHELTATARDLTSELVRRLTSVVPPTDRVDAALATVRQ